MPLHDNVTWTKDWVNHVMRKTIHHETLESLHVYFQYLCTCLRHQGVERISFDGSHLLRLLTPPSIIVGVMFCHNCSGAPEVIPRPMENSFIVFFGIQSSLVNGPAASVRVQVHRSCCAQQAEIPRNGLHGVEFSAVQHHYAKRKCSYVGSNVPYGSPICQSYCRSARVGIPYVTSANHITYQLATWMEAHPGRLAVYQQST
mmetsp:Transcript_40353/g.67041  ORF Transcript_40353/g.67041 Transcript_40353/m.67041 type:complete len:202 (-) Transcript_40353:119-724(-)